HVPETEREESRPAHVHVHAESRIAAGSDQRRAETPVEEREGSDQAESPEADQQDRRQRAEDHEEVLAAVSVGGGPGGCSPRGPQRAGEGGVWAKTPRAAPRHEHT